MAQCRARSDATRGFACAGQALTKRSRGEAKLAVESSPAKPAKSCLTVCMLLGSLVRSQL